ncbi:MAG TPA: ATP-binding protein [Urbifossiella sp.]|nr:ATP-binding protein [Urbifossiella sp.]
MELVILVGLQGSGKTTFYRERFAATHAHVSKDNFRSNPRPARRQRRLIAEAFAAGRSVVVDNTNPTAADRAELVEGARAAGAAVVCYFFPPDVDASLRRNAAREGKARVPDHAVRITAARLEPPPPAEGFDRLYRVRLADGGGFEVTEVGGGGDAAG